jgi:high affinity sulfate transporter 1
VLTRYRRAWLGRDVVAGLVLVSILVPAGMGYASAAGLPAINGLYATIAGLVAYAIFGPSRILVLGPDSGLVALIAAAIAAQSAEEPARAVAVGALLALFTGLFCGLAAVVRAGFLTDLLSKPVRVGYMNGIALTILVSQSAKLLGIAAPSGSLIEGISCLGRGIAEGRENRVALAVGGSSLVFILVTRRFFPRLPGIFVAVVASTAAVALFGLRDRLSVVGAVPRGVPLPAIPDLHGIDWRALVTEAMGIALVAFADTSVLSRTFAARHAYRVDPNRELFGLGVANAAAGLFGGFPISSSASRTPVAEAAGSRTQVTGLVGAAAMIALLALAPGLVRDLPTTALAAVVLAAAIKMFDFGALVTFHRVRRSDFVVAMLAFGAVAALGVLPGIGIAVVVSLLDFVRRAWRPHDAVLGRAPGVKGYHDVSRYPDAKQVPGLLLFRWDAPLFFANADGFRQRILEVVDDAPRAVRWVVVAAEPITDVDTTAAEMIQDLDEDLAARGVELAFAEMKDPVKDRLQRYGLKAKIGRDFFFPTVGVAVKEYLARNAVVWTDWEEAS